MKLNQLLTLLAFAIIGFGVYDLLNTDSVSVGASGVLVPHGDVAALAEQIKAVTEGAFSPLQRASVEWAANFSWEASARKFLNVLDSVAGLDVDTHE